MSIVEKFANIPTTCVSDAMQGLNNLDPSIKPLAENMDGAIRGVRGCKALNYPVFCKGTTVAAGGKAGMGEINVPISCGGVSVSPGDLIVGDADGVVVVPQAIENEVLEKALERIRFDEQRVAQVAGNREEILRYLDKMLSK